MLPNGFVGQLPGFQIQAGLWKSLQDIRPDLYDVVVGFAEVIEAEVSENSPIINSSVEDLNMPRDVIVGAVIRDDNVIIPQPNFTIRAGDIVVILASRAQTQNVEKMFSVQVDIF